MLSPNVYLEEYENRILQIALAKSELSCFVDKLNSISEHKMISKYLRVSLDIFSEQIKQHSS